MSNQVEPMIKLEQTPDPKKGGVPVLSYNVPEPTSYTGQNFLELDFIPKGKTAKDYFKPECFKSKSDAEHKAFDDLRALDKPSIASKLNENFKGSIANSLFANAKMASGVLKLGDKDGNAAVVSDQKISKSLERVTVDEISYQVKLGNKLNIYRNMYGELTSNFIPSKPPLRPRLVLLETYKLSSFMGSYGAGKTLNTFSLLPGEKTKISIKSYRKTETSSKEASSILDSFTKESSEDFERSVLSENSSKQNSADSFEYHAEAEASASFGVASAKVSGGVKGGCNSSREEFAKNVQNATSKHANKASAKRDIQINSSTEVKEQTGEETEIVREIENINVSRTLNFVFRQMNQEFISILHLIDIRIAFFNGEASSRREYTLPELDQLIDDFIIQDQNDVKRNEVKQMILNQLLNIQDYQDKRPTGFDQSGNPTNKYFIQEKDVLGIDDSKVGIYYQFSKDQYSRYSDQTGREILVNGIILSVSKNVLRTDSVIVDSILGQGDALDGYSKGLQDELITEKKLNNELKKAEINRNRLAAEIVSEKDSDMSKIYEQVYPVSSEKKHVN